MPRQYNQYSVPPFSGEVYRTGNLSWSKSEPCAICGRCVANPKHYATVTAGGARWATPEDDREDPGFMGTWPVGSDCHRKYHVKENE